MTLPTTFCDGTCSATRHNSAHRTNKASQLRRFRAACRPRLTNLPLVEPHHVKTLAVACFRLLQTRFIIELSPACTMAFLNPSTSRVLKHTTHPLNARNVGIASSPRPPGANVAAS
eukprot:scaffold932_cov328-Pavlova_lutheri.AAC.26